MSMLAMAAVVFYYTGFKMCLQLSIFYRQSPPNVAHPG